MELLAILTDSMKLVSKNGKLMALIALFSLFFSSSLVCLLSFSTQSLVRAMFASIQQSLMPDPGSTNGGFDPAKSIHLLHQLRQDYAYLYALQLSFALVSSIVSFLSAISTILVSALSHDAKNSSLKQLLSMMWATWANALITCFYVSALSTAYFVAVAAFAAPLWIYPDLPTSWLSPLILVPSSILYLYLCVPWTVSMVVAVVEEDCCGMGALGKAAALVKGRRLHGFLLNVCYGLVFLIVFMCYAYSQTRVAATLVIATAVSCLVKISMFVSYTVFYLRCKMQHGENRDQVQLRPTLGYTKLSTAMDMA